MDNFDDDGNEYVIFSMPVDSFMRPTEPVVPEITVEKAQLQLDTFTAMVQARPTV